MIGSATGATAPPRLPAPPGAPPPPTNGALTGGEVPPRVTGKYCRVRLLTPTTEPSSAC